MPAKKPAARKAAPRPTSIRRTVRAGQGGSALAEEALKSMPPPVSPGASTMTGRQPTVPPPAKIEIGEDDPSTPPVRSVAPKPHPHWRSRP